MVMSNILKGSNSDLYVLDSPVNTANFLSALLSVWLLSYFQTLYLRTGSIIMPGHHSHL